MALRSNTCWRQRWGKKRLFRFALHACCGKQALSMRACEAMTMTSPKGLQVAPEAPDDLQAVTTTLQNAVSAAEATRLDCASVSQGAHVCPRDTSRQVRNVAESESGTRPSHPEGQACRCGKARLVMLLDVGCFLRLDGRS